MHIFLKMCSRFYPLLVFFVNALGTVIFRYTCYSNNKNNNNNKQLMNEAEYLIKNYGDRGRCYPSRP